MGKHDLEKSGTDRTGGMNKYLPAHGASQIERCEWDSPRRVRRGVITVTESGRMLLSLIYFGESIEGINMETGKHGKKTGEKPT